MMTPSGHPIVHGTNPTGQPYMHLLLPPPVHQYATDLWSKQQQRYEEEKHAMR